MISDTFNRVATLQSIAGATASLSDSIDLLAAKDVGAGRDLFAIFLIPAAALVLNASSATGIFEVVVADNDALTTNTTVVGSSAAIAKADLTVGRAPIIVAINPQYASLGRRYLGVRVRANDAAAMTSGTFTAFIGPVPDTGDGPKPYPSGFSV